jgi:uncharacterized lipoprotein YmbA
MKERKHLSGAFAWVILTALAMGLTGCAGSSKPSTFYLLRSLPEAEQGVSKAAGKEGLSVLIGPITIPAYADRPQIITITGEREMTLEEFARWAEPLQDNFNRVLVENLSLLLNTPQVYSFNSRGSMSTTDFQIVIDITRFDGTPGGVVGKDPSAQSERKKFVYHAKSPSAGLAGILDAQNRTLTEFSREIAKTIQSLHR